MARRRRINKGGRTSFAAHDLVGGPLWFWASSEEAAQARVDAMRSWYIEHGDSWEREQAEERPGTRSWAWWAFTVGVVDPFALSDEEKLRRIVAGGHLFEFEAEAIFATAAHFREHVGDFRDPSGRPFYAEHASERPIFGVDPRLWPARVLRETLSDCQ